MANTYEMQDLGPLNHLAVNAWVRDRRDSSCRSWAVKVILGLCIGVLAAAVVALSIMLSTHCSASPGQRLAAYTSTVSTTLTETRDSTATTTGTATMTTTIMETKTASAGGTRTTVTETKISIIHKPHLDFFSSITPDVFTRTSYQLRWNQIRVMEKWKDCIAGLPCSSGKAGSNDASGREILLLHPDCEDILIASLAGTTDQSLVNSSNTQSENTTVVSNCMFECREDDVNIPGRVMHLACCAHGLDSDGTHCVHS